MKLIFNFLKISLKSFYNYSMISKSDFQFFLIKENSPLHTIDILSQNLFINKNKL